jgi:hypothetical protein
VQRERFEQVFDEHFRAVSAYALRCVPRRRPNSRPAPARRGRATYELLPATAANLALLSLRKQHPGATVVPDVTVEGFGSDPAKGK